MYSKFHKGLSLDGFRGTNLVVFPNHELYDYLNTQKSQIVVFKSLEMIYPNI